MPKRPQAPSDSPPFGLRMVAALPRLALTRAVGRAARLPIPPALRGPLYRGVARLTGADLSEAQEDASSFTTLDGYFTRALRPGIRPVDAPQNAWVSPCDGRLDAHGRIHEGRLLQAKGIAYRASELLADPDADDAFSGGAFATVYLSPADYHRVHAPTQMEIRDVLHIGGDLWPVNGLSVPHLNDLFVINERVVARFVDGQGRPGALVMVGATVVGAMSVQGGIALRSDHREALRRVRLDPAWSLERGGEFGAFHLGSTVVLLLQDASAPLSIAAKSGRIRLGEVLYRSDS